MEGFRYTLFVGWFVFAICRKLLSSGGWRELLGLLGEDGVLGLVLLIYKIEIPSIVKRGLEKRFLLHCHETAISIIYRTWIPFFVL